MSMRLDTLKFSLAIFMVLVAVQLSSAQVGNNNGLFQSAVGGVRFDTEGVLSKEPVGLEPNLRNELLNSLSSVDDDIAKAGMRMISLKGLEAQIAKAEADGQPLPADVQFMAGLQRLEYVIVDKENNDILLAGPAEPWTVTESGAVVGKATGTPVLHLEDFIVAMRSVNDARQGQGVSVSIDPTAEGARTLQRVLNGLKSFHPNMADRIAEAYGPQQVSLTGVPKDSRFSQILVAADYKMKRLAMGLEASPIEDFPSLLEIARRKDARFKTASPRFWMECNYEPVAKDADGTIFKIRGSGVKALTEDQFFDKDGNRKLKAKTNKFAKAWADSMTERYDELSVAEPVFRELRNLMDMSVAAAIIEQNRLTAMANVELPNIRGTADQFVSLPAWNVPTTIPAECSFVHLSRTWLVTASGGVQVDSWAVASESEVSDDVGEVAQVAMVRTAERWWWNAN